jgi:WD40 repeat protein
VGSDGKLVLVDAETGSVTATFTLLGPKKETILPVCAAYSDGMLALAGKGSRNNLCVYKLADAVEGVAELKPLLMAKDQFNEKLRLAIPVDCRAVCFAGKERVVVSTGTGAIDVYPIKASTKPVLPSFSKKILPKDSVVRGLYPCPESDAILISDGQGVLEAFDLAAGKPIGRFAGHEGAITAAISVRVNKRQLLISGSKDRFLRIFDFATRKLLFKQYMKYVPSSVMARLEPESASGAESNSDSETSSLWDEMQIAPESKKQRLN